MSIVEERVADVTISEKPLKIINWKKISYENR